ncbi:unnamed protein product [Parascedosporium putredinis]|uniref:Importin N-terminal domain-containing protein n=1 Tax=Parascedosporium putredinis TaxID=1442378 RepID=A0A9P1HAF4_9PEZI|nr:unnamed protein product [Parascedosporium putredinis]CAI8002597.1 unnamed protein product [Parascedosporium putredinis]
MSFAIEAPGEAQPLTPAELFVALRDAAASSTPAPRRQAVGQQLTSWESQQGYYSSLQLKNGIDRHWRLFNHVKGGLTEPEKAAIRSRLFQGTVEEDNKALALQNALAVAKVVRIDYQKAWPEALPSLIALLRTYKNGDENKVHGSLQVVLRVVKEMSTARLRTSQTALQGITPELSHILGEIICVKIAHRPFQSFRYRSDDEKKDRETAVELLKTQWLTNDFVTQITNTLITRLFLFRKSDLDAWEQDPEEWEQREQGEGNAYEFEVRPCAEKLFLDFLTSYKDLLIPPLLGYFNASTDPNADLTTKEAVYTAMGLAAAHLSTYFHNNKPESEGRQNIDFDSFLETTLVRDSQQQGPLAKVLRRRIGILLSQWVTVQSTERNRPVIYQLFTHFMNPNDECNDLVVRITAARQLRWVVDEMYFDVDKFLPFATDVMSQLADLVSTIDVDESKLAILETMRLLVTRIENHATHFADFLMSALPQIWEASGTEEFMIKQAVIAIFSALVMSMGPESQRYQHHIVPLIAESARPGSGLHGHLIDESLELWNSVVMQSNPPLSGELVNIYELAIPLLEYETETASASLDLVESYILMAPEAILEDRFRRPTLIGLGELLKSQSRERVRQATVCIEYVIRSATELGGVSGVTVVLQDLMEIGLLGAIIEALHDAWDAHQTTGRTGGPSRAKRVCPSALTVRPGRWGMELASIPPRAHPVPGTWRTYTAVGAQQAPGLPDYVDQHHLGPPGRRRDGLPYHDGASPEEWHCPKNTRENELMLKDPVHSVHAFEFVKARIADVVQRVGGEQRFQEDWVANVDRDVMDRFQQLSQFMASKGK